VTSDERIGAALRLTLRAVSDSRTATVSERQGRSQGEESEVWIDSCLSG